MKHHGAAKRIVQIVSAAALLSIGSAWNARPARAGDSAEAEALIRQGVELRAQKKDERALPLFEKAYQLSRTPRTAGQLGLVEMALGYFVDAEKYLSEALASPDHPWVAKNLATLKAQLATAKSQIGELYIVGEPNGAEVLVNGKVVGKLPLSTPIRLDKGRAEIQVRASGYVATTDTVAMTGGKREDRSYRLQREAVAVAPPPPVQPVQPVLPVQPAMPRPVETTTPVAAAPPPAGGEPAASISTTPAPDQGGGSSSLRPVAWGVGIAAGAGLLFGAVEGIIAVKKKNEFNDHMGPDPAGGGQIYDCGTDALNPACESIKKSHDSARTLSIVGFVAAGVLAGGAAVLWVLSSPKERGGSASASASGFACTPVLGSGGVACRLQF